MNEHREASEMLEKLVVQGDLSKLSPGQRLAYYERLCESVGLNPYSRPFEYLNLSGKLVLYARKDATDQLRKRDNVSIAIVSRDRVEDVYVVVARAVRPDGRADESIGAVPLVDGRSGKPLTGEALANAFMKAEAKAKRRVTLSICGLGMLDETEVSSVPDARPVHIDAATGEILEPGVRPAPVEPGARPVAFDELRKALEQASDRRALNSASKRVADARAALSEAQLDELRAVRERRGAELSEAAPAEVSA